MDLVKGAFQLINSGRLKPDEIDKLKPWLNGRLDAVRSISYSIFDRELPHFTNQKSGLYDENRIATQEEVSGFLYIAALKLGNAERENFEGFMAGYFKWKAKSSYEGGEFLAKSRFNELNPGGDIKKSFGRELFALNDAKNKFDRISKSSLLSSDLAYGKWVEKNLEGINSINNAAASLQYRIEGEKLPDTFLGFKSIFGRNVTRNFAEDLAGWGDVALTVGFVAVGGWPEVAYFSYQGVRDMERDPMGSGILLTAMWAGRIAKVMEGIGSLERVAKGFDISGRVAGSYLMGGMGINTINAISDMSEYGITNKSLQGLTTDIAMMYLGGKKSKGDTKGMEWADGKTGQDKTTISGERYKLSDFSLVDPNTLAAGLGSFKLGPGYEQLYKSLKIGGTESSQIKMKHAAELNGGLHLETPGTKDVHGQMQKTAVTQHMPETTLENQKTVTMQEVVEKGAMNYAEAINGFVSGYQNSKTIPELQDNMIGFAKFMAGQKPTKALELAIENLIGDDFRLESPELTAQLSGPVPRGLGDMYQLKANLDANWIRSQGNIYSDLAEVGHKVAKTSEFLSSSTGKPVQILSILRDGAFLGIGAISASPELGEFSSMPHISRKSLKSMYEEAITENPDARAPAQKYNFYKDAIARPMDSIIGPNNESAKGLFIKYSVLFRGQYGLDPLFKSVADKVYSQLKETGAIKCGQDGLPVPQEIIAMDTGFAHFPVFLK
ncbi:MAG TPA: hypothetical protein PLO51_02500, partial [Candidatus Micrarchaeota archaeon]|nr:hypothetical protein [Candidatus Micrarchaeota archaeon]